MGAYQNSVDFLSGFRNRFDAILEGMPFDGHGEAILYLVNIVAGLKASEVELLNLDIESTDIDPEPL